MEDITAKIPYDGTTTPVPATAIHAADEFNDRRVEFQGAVEDSAQTLDSADPGQLSKTLFVNGVAAQSMLDSGAANTVVLTPITGANGLRVATPVVKTYDLLDGAIFNFAANATNSGNMTVNVGQTAGTLIGAESLFLEDGTTNVPVGKVVAGRFYNVRYDLSNTRFVLLSSGVFTPELMTGANDSDGTVTDPNGLILKWGKASRTGVDTTITFAVAFPNACFQAFAMGGTNADVLRHPSAYSPTTANFKVQCNDAAMTTFRWFAIGR